MIKLNDSKSVTSFSELPVIEKLKRIVHYFFTVIMYSIMLVMIIVFIIIIINFIDQNNNLRKGQQKPALVSAYTIVSPSMVPNINVLDVIIITRVSDPSKIKVGDVITFNSTDYRSSGVTVTHRVRKIEKTSDGKYLFTTKGDANNTEDATRQPFSSIYGKVLIRIPKLGYIQYALSSVLGWILLIIVPTVIIIGLDVVKIIKTIKNDSRVKSNSAVKIIKKNKIKEKAVKIERNRYK